MMRPTFYGGLTTLEVVVRQSVQGWLSHAVGTSLWHIFSREQGPAFFPLLTTHIQWYLLLAPFYRYVLRIDSPSSR
jgi:predicted membrane-bound dolichyl-phosphate-mannose-protein mannosyltransferase